MDNFHAKCDRTFDFLGTDSDAVLIVPPFADLYRPSLGVHLLQAAAEKTGLRLANPFRESLVLHPERRGSLQGDLLRQVRLDVG